MRKDDKMKNFLWYIYNVLVGDVPNTEKSFFDAEGDIIFEPNDDAHSFDILMENGRTYRLTITEVE